MKTLLSLFILMPWLALSQESSICAPEQLANKALAVLASIGSKDISIYKEALITQDEIDSLISKLQASV